MCFAVSYKPEIESENQDTNFSVLLVEIGLFEKAHLFLSSSNCLAKIKKNEWKVFYLKPLLKAQDL